MNKFINRSCGFTLIELMIVVTVAAILMAVGYPAYQQYVIKARRTDAGANLLELTQHMERFFTETGSYCEVTGTTPSSACATSHTLPYTQSPKEGSAKFYNIALSNDTSNTFTLTATPTGTQTSDTDCGALSINAAGVKCIKGGASCSNNASASVQQAVRDCW